MPDLNLRLTSSAESTFRKPEFVLMVGSASQPGDGGQTGLVTVRIARRGPVGLLKEAQ